jgi:hypothetical protein
VRHSVPLDDRDDQATFDPDQCGPLGIILLGDQLAAFSTEGRSKEIVRMRPHRVQDRRRPGTDAMKTLDSPLPNPPSVIVHNAFQKLSPRRPIRTKMTKMPALVGCGSMMQGRGASRLKHAVMLTAVLILLSVAVQLAISQ